MTKPKKSNNRIIYILLAFIGIFLVILMVGKSQGWIGKKPEIKVELALVERANIVEKVAASGMIQPVVEVKISPEVAGEIIRLDVSEGDSVRQGDFLIKIRPDNFVSAYERAKANLNQTQANQAEASARLARAEASFVRAELEYNRQKQLIAEKVISAADFELAEANYKIAKQDLESGKQSLEAARYIVKSASATVAEAGENLRRTNIIAPMSGIISKLSVEKGETVVGTSQMQGTEMLRIADLSNMEVRVDVNENDIIRIKVGDTALIDVDAYAFLDKEFKGVVTQIANTAKNKVSSDAVTEFEVRIKILNESYGDLVRERGIKYPFRPGMTASVEILTDKRENVVTVPLAAVTTRLPEGKKSDEKDETTTGTLIVDKNAEEVVFVEVEGKAVKTKVKTGISDFERIEILEGLSEGQKVVSGPFLVVSKRLKDGDAITDQATSEKKKE